jgi:hypothetical protein
MVSCLKIIGWLPDILEKKREKYLPSLAKNIPTANLIDLKKGRELQQGCVVHSKWKKRRSNAEGPTVQPGKGIDKTAKKDSLDFLL